MTSARPVRDQSSGPKAVSVVAHRGSSHDAPEHTLSAYRRAVEDGADAVECDVRMTADGHLVCVHDRRVNRTSNGRGTVSALELADLAALDFGSWRKWRDEPETPAWYGTSDPERDPERTSVLTLERLLEFVVDAGRRIEVAVEIKRPTRWHGEVERRIEELLRRFGLLVPPPDAPPQVRVMSFSVRSLDRVHLMMPQVPTVCLMQFLTPRLREGRLPAGARIAGPSLRIVRNHPEYVARAHAAGNEVHVWTVDDPSDVAACTRLGVDAIITNRPRAVLAQLGR